MSVLNADSRALFRQRANPAAKALITKILGLREPLVIPDAPDYDTLQNFRKLLPKTAKKSFDPTARATSRVKDIMGLIRREGITSYLDLGCGNGVITAAVGTALHLPRSQVHGTDINGWLDNDDRVSADIDFFISRSNFPLRSVSLVTAFQVLHHIPNVEQTVTALADTIPQGGQLLIREHDAGSPELKDLVDLEHFLYLTLHGTLDKMEDYYGAYRSRTEWTTLLTATGFKLIKDTEPYGPTRYYYALYERS